MTLSGVGYVAKSFFRVEETGPDDSAEASENLVELKLELCRIVQGQWFLDKFYEHAKLNGVASIYQGMIHSIIIKCAKILMPGVSRSSFC